MTRFAIEVQALGKEYLIGGGDQRPDTFREMLAGVVVEPFRKLRRLRGTVSEKDHFWALRDVSFNVEPGEIVGIIGRNGAGKSTLLKLLSRITSPTTGKIMTRGRTASLLEVGTGFHQELTGRENIYLNGAILGMTRAEIEQHFADIVAFAETEAFLDTPVKRYSSGMYVRLAFAVAAHLDADILVVDEVLAVGDHVFQQKCLGKMAEVAQSGRTVLFVSHNMNAIQKLCKRCLLLSQGRIAGDGAVSDVVEKYLSRGSGLEKSSQPMWARGPLADALNFTKITSRNQRGEVQKFKDSDEIIISVEGSCNRELNDLQVVVGVDTQGVRLFNLSDCVRGEPISTGKFSSHFRISSGQLLAGKYAVSVGAYRQIKADWCWVPNCTFFEVYGHAEERRQDQGVVRINYDSKREFAQRVEAQHEVSGDPRANR